MVNMNEIISSTPALLSALPAADFTNPFTGMVPLFQFGPEFDALWKKVFATFWGLLLIVAAAFLLYNLVMIARANDSGNPHEAQGSKKAAMRSGLALGGAVAFIPILSLIFFVF